MARRLILLGVSFGMLGGCVIFDDLEVENRFAFPIFLRRQSRNLQKKSVLEKIG